MGINYPGATYVGALLLANSSWSLTYSSKSDLYLTSVVSVVVYVVDFHLFVYPYLLSFNVATCHFYCSDGIYLLFLADQR